MPETRLSLKDYVTGFSRPFWAANISELFERVAFYGMQSVLVNYLIKVRQFNESGAIWIRGNLTFIVFILTVFAGMFADWLGYRRAMFVAYGVLLIGYAGVWGAPSFPLVVVALLLVAAGAAIIKPAITGTVQRTCSEERRPVGFSIYYTLVNVGGFLGPNAAGAVAAIAGSLVPVFPMCASAIAIALVIVLLFFREGAETGESQAGKLRKFVREFGVILRTPRLVTLFLLVAGFWSLFWQFFDAFATYATKELALSQQWYSFILSLDAGLIVVFQVLIGYLVRNWSASRAVWISAFVGTASYAVLGLGMSKWIAVAGILVFSIGEMIYSAHFYKYLGSLAPPGQEGMYLGFAFLPIALGSLLSGWIGGPIAGWARDTLHRPLMMFWAFGAIGLISAIGLWVHAKVYATRDARA